MLFSYGSKKITHCTDQTCDFMEPSCKRSGITPQKVTELENALFPNLKNVTISCYHTEPLASPTEIINIKNVVQRLIFLENANKIRRTH